jgi:hypothetical protein
VSNSPVPPPNHTDLYRFVGLPVFLLILGAGVTGLVTGRISLEVFLVLLGISIVGIALMAHLLKWYRFTMVHALISAMAALLVSWLFFGYVLWPKPTPYVNPLRSKATKWDMARDLQWWRVATSPQHPNCQIAIVRYPETYSQDYASDFKEILDVAGWKYTPDHIVVDGSLEKGIAVRTVKTGTSGAISGPSEECASFLDTRIRNDMHGRYGGDFSTVLQWRTLSEASDFLKQCPSGSGCVEVTFGNEDTTR